MWLGLAFISALFLGFYDVSKKMSLINNAVIPVLFINTLICSLILMPLYIISKINPSVLEETVFFMPSLEVSQHVQIFIKSMITLSAWISGFFAVKNLPLTVTGPISSMRPIIAVVGAIIIFGEVLNAWQWAGVSLTIIAFFLLSRTTRKEGIVFAKNKWIFLMVLSTLLNSASGLYDKHLMSSLPSTSVQFWFNTYQFLMMIFIMLFIWFPKRKQQPFRWSWYILLLALFLTIADFVYFYALSLTGSLIAIISMVRRSSVIISFLGGAIVLGEKNLKGKAFDLFLILISMFFLYLGR